MKKWHRLSPAKVLKERDLLGSTDRNPRRPSNLIAIIMVSPRGETSAAQVSGEISVSVLRSEQPLQDLTYYHLRDHSLQRAKSHYGRRRRTILPRPQPPGSPRPQAPPHRVFPRQRTNLCWPRLPWVSLSICASVAIMVSIPASFPSSVEDETARPSRPSVTWDLDLYKDYKSSSKATASSGATGNLDLRRDQRGDRQETGHGVQPKVYFFRPRTSQPSVFFRCSLGSPELS
ncbi:Hypothetical predicted protein [Marmota monax]|uniref:Uncharacterized protein n=1 Tax=Marmota monax TaxID=9995 RepID=A0A5E4AV59_MARMO|nr:Hypothetical predicted protein [Marmota monax]